MTRFRFAWLACWTLGALAAFLPASALAQTSIEVVVNGRPITSYDVSQRVALQRIGGETASTRAATEQLIEEAIPLSEFERLGGTLPEGQVDAAFQSIARQVNLSVSEFNTALRQAGVNQDSLRARLEAQIAWQGLVERRLVQNSPVRNEDVTAALLGDAGPRQTIKEFILQQVLFVVPSGSSAARIAQRRREAEAFRQRFPGCEGSVALASQLRDVVVRNIGRRDTTQLGGRQGEEIQNTRAGRTTGPNQTEQGIELIAVCEIREIQSNAAARAEVEERLILGQAERIGEEYLAELKAKAIIERR